MEQNGDIFKGLFRNSLVKSDKCLKQFFQIDKKFVWISYLKCFPICCLVNEFLFGRLTENAWQESKYRTKKGSKQVPIVHIKRWIALSTGQRSIRWVTLSNFWTTGARKSTHSRFYLRIHKLGFQKDMISQICKFRKDNFLALNFSPRDREQEMTFKQGALVSKKGQFHLCKWLWNLHLLICYGEF